jgi:CelD/BcsL family acetyltransferase involved in cellulose biosynthesis
MNDQPLLLIPPDDPRWLGLLEDIPSANIFQHPGWLHTLADAYGYRPFIVGVPGDSGTLAAGLPVMDVRSLLTGRRWVSLPFSDYSRPICRDDTAFVNLTAALVHLTAQDSTPRLEMRWPFHNETAMTNYTHFVWHTLPLQHDSAAVKQQFHRTQRQNIRTAQKNGIAITQGSDPAFLETFYQLQVQTRSRQGMPVQPQRFFTAMQRHLLDRGLGFIMLAHKGDHCLAAGLFLHYGGTLTYKYAASDDHPDSRKLRPNNLLTWSAMQWGCAHDCTLFDFGRSDIDNQGLRTYKNRWGAAEIPLEYTIALAPAPSLNEGRMMQTMHKVIRQSPPWVSEGIGRLLYGHFG